MTNEHSYSPMMQQWHQAKQKAQGAVVLFRLGDFYEAFEEDAIFLAKELELTLTKRQDIPMSGIPAHTIDLYLDKLVGKGHKIALVEQMEDPKSVKGLVKRDISRIVTPGTLIHSSHLKEKANNFLISLHYTHRIYGLAILDLTTAEFLIFETKDEQALIDELAKLQPAEILLSKKCPLTDRLQQEYCLTEKDEWYFDAKIAQEYLLKHFSVYTLDGFGISDYSSALSASGSLLFYVKEELNLPTQHITHLKKQQNSDFLYLSYTTQKHLELLSPLNDGKQNYTLLNHLDHTKTPMGGRLLRKWISYPLRSKVKIEERQNVISSLIQQPNLLFSLREKLEQIKDIERLMMRIQSGYAFPKDLVLLASSLQNIPSIKDLLQPILSSEYLVYLEQLEDTTTIVHLIQSHLEENPSNKLGEGGVFRSGIHTELDEIMSLKKDSESWIVDYQNKLREITEIKTLKVGYTRAFGYYIEVSRGQASKIPDYFQRRQTLVNGERFITEELKSYEHKIETASQKILHIEQTLFHDLKHKITTFSSVIKKNGEGIAHIDALLCLAFVAQKYNYVKPRINEEQEIKIKQGRHPVIESSLGSKAFIPNDTLLNESDHKLVVLTGPNMAGKSTYIRQVALLVIMTQIGSFIPAEEASISLVDQVFTRIGASDDLSRGQSTFMVEMAETANILNNATQNSLIVLDEIGRGTSTYDGISIAWAVAEYLLSTSRPKGKTLFATHYWELTALEDQIPGAVNYHVAVHEGKEGIVFLRKIVKGSTDKSYGIHVAKLAGLPHQVIKTAESRLISFENKSPIPLAPQKLPISFTSPLEEELKNCNPMNMTPLEAIQKLILWKSFYEL